MINGSLFTAIPGTVDVMNPTQTPLNNPLMIIIGISLGTSIISEQNESLNRRKPYKTSVLIVSSLAIAH